MNDYVITFSVGELQMKENMNEIYTIYINFKSNHLESMPRPPSETVRTIKFLINL